jgi:hypothetical protein
LIGYVGRRLARNFVDLMSNAGNAGAELGMQELEQEPELELEWELKWEIEWEPETGAG